MIKFEYFKERSLESGAMTWHLSLLNKRNKGLYFSFNRFWRGVYVHFSKTTHRLFFSNGKFGRDSYSTKNIDKQIEG